MRLVVWFLPVLSWGFFGILALRFRMRLPATPLRVLRARSPQRYYPLPFALFFLALGVPALIEDVRTGLVFFLFLVPFAFWAVDTFRFIDVVISDEFLFQYFNVVPWKDAKEIRETWYGHSVRLRNGLFITIVRFTHTVTPDDVEVMRRCITESSRGGAA